MPCVYSSKQTCFCTVGKRKLTALTPIVSLHYSYTTIAGTRLQNLQVALQVDLQVVKRTLIVWWKPEIEPKM